MTRTEVIRPFLEKTLAEWLESGEIRQSDKGEYLFRHGSAEICIRIDEGPQTVVSIYSVILRKVKKSARLLDALNAINSEIDCARIFWLENAVVLVTELLASTLEAEQVRTACQIVSRLADGLDTRLKKTFGGKTAFPDERPRSDEVDV